MSQEAWNALLIALMPFLVSLAVSLFRVLVAKLPANKAAMAGQVSQIVVQAAEQIYKAAPGSSEQKKAEALDMASTMLKDLGLKVSPATLNALIESAVHSLPPKVQG